MISVEALVSYARELEVDVPGSGVAWLKARRAEALAKINGGGGQDYVSAAANGKSFTRRFHATAQEWFEQVQNALEELNATRVKVTYPTFSNIPH